MTPRELRATLDCLDLSAAEAGHLLGVHRATVYRWLDGSRGRAAAASDGGAWNPANGGDRVASWSDKRKAAVGPIAGEIDKADCPPQYTCQVQAGRGTQEARADAAIRQDGGRARLSRDPHRRGRQAAGGLIMLQQSCAELTRARGL